MTPAEILAFFGRPIVLVKLKERDKIPVEKDWQNRTPEDMTPEFCASLNGNVGVVNGRRSNHLVTIDWDNEKWSREFFELNKAWARSTLWTKGARGVSFWVFLRGEYPPAGKFKVDAVEVGEWRSDGNQTVFCGVHPETGKEYQQGKQPPVEVAFEDIVWPEGLSLPWIKPAPQPPAEFNDAELQNKCGPPLWFNTRGVLTKINENYFVQRFCLENLVLFEQDEQWFYFYWSQIGAWGRVQQDFVKEMVRTDWERLTKLFRVPDMERFAKDAVFNSLVSGIKSHSGRREVFKPLENIIHCRNGMLHLTIKGDENIVETCEFSPDYYARNPCPIPWEPTAVAPRFKAILDTMDPADASLYLRYTANAYLGGNPSQQFLILSGERGTSKSTLCDITEITIGRKNVAELRTKELDGRFEIGRYVGKTLLSGKDVKGNFLQQEGASSIKKLTGHDMLTGEAKHSMVNQEIYGQFAMIITCNERLTVKLEGDTDMGAWERRILIINFTAKNIHKEVISHYSDKLVAEEGEGIMVLIVAAAFDHLREIARHGVFTQSEEQKARVTALLAESRSVEMFVKDRIERDPGGEGISTDEISVAYTEYCEEMGWEPISLGILVKQLPGYMLRYWQSNVGSHITREKNGRQARVRGYPNVSIKTEQDQPAPENPDPDEDMFE